MYYYIIDPQKINQKTFERVQNQLYSCLSEHRISGEMTRVTSLRTVGQLVDTAFLRGATTIVAVGHDSTVQEIINSVGDRDATIGYVPLQESEMSRVLGVGDVVGACASLAHRRVENLDLAKVQSQYFFTRVGVGSNLDAWQGIGLFNMGQYALDREKPVHLKMDIDGQFHAEFEVALGGVFNSRPVKADSRVGDPTDGMLDVLLLPPMSGFSAWKYKTQLVNGLFEEIPGCAVIHGRRIAMSSPENLPIYAGDKAIAKVPAVFEASAKKIKFIVGKDRTF